MSETRCRCGSEFSAITSEWVETPGGMSVEDCPLIDRTHVRARRCWICGLSRQEVLSMDEDDDFVWIVDRYL